MASRDRTSEKFIGYSSLVRACGQPGCPICRCVRDDSRRLLDALLYEHVTDPETRKTLRETRGFCNWHTWMMLEIDAGRFGPSILYEDLLGRACDRVATAAVRAAAPRAGTWRAWLRRLTERRRRSRIVEPHTLRPACSLCVAAATAERGHLETLLTFFDDGDLQASYASADPVCLPHLMRATELMPGAPTLAALIDRTREKWMKVRRDLQSFIEKHDHRNTRAFTDDEAASYVRAFEILAGAKGLFGNDLAAGRGEAVPPGTAS
jgi:hypothetical protein